MGFSEWAKAQEEYQASVDAGGGIPALRKLAQAQMQRRDMKEVEKTIDALTREGAREEDLLLLKVIVALRTGEVVQATQLLAAATDSPQKNYGTALLAVIQGDNKEARAALDRVVAGWEPTLRAYARALQAAYQEFETFPQSRPIHLSTLLARSLAQVQECELALPLLAQVIREQDDYRDAWIVQGYCELTTERDKEALASFERAYTIDPEKPEVQYFLGRTYMVLKDTKKALTFFQYALENGFEPRGEVRARLAYAALEEGNTSLALEQYEELARGENATPDIAEKLVTLSITLDKKDEAYAAASAAAGRWPDDAVMHGLLGWAAQELGRKDEAKAELEKALHIDPTLQSARERLGRL